MNQNERTIRKTQELRDIQFENDSPKVQADYQAMQRVIQNIICPLNDLQVIRSETVCAQGFDRKHRNIMNIILDQWIINIKKEEIEKLKG